MPRPLPRGLAGTSIAARAWNAPHARTTEGEQQMTRTTLLGSVLVLALGACAPSVASVRPHTAVDIEPEQIHGPYVPKGTRFMVRLEDTLDTRRSRPGQGFQATVLTPLRTPDGKVVVPAGSTLVGTVVSTGRPDRPRLRLRFDSIETVHGAAPLVADIEHSERTRYRGPPRLRPTPLVADEVSIAPSGRVGIPPVGGGPAWDVNPPLEIYSPREVHLARGALLELELSEPLIPPGTRVERAE